MACSAGDIYGIFVSRTDGDGDKRQHVSYRSHLLASGPGTHLALALAQVKQDLGPII
jgi:hypothetical protein